MRVQKPRSLMYPLVTVSALLLLSHDWPLTCAHPSSGSTSSTYGRDRFNSNSKCIDIETGRELYVGDSFTRSGRCIRVQCLGSLQLWEDRCQVPRLESNCYRVPAANEFLDYPRCCPTYECKLFKSDDNSITDENRTYDHYGRLLKENITIQRIRVLVKPPVHLTTISHPDGLNKEYSGTAPDSTRTSSSTVGDSTRFEIKYN